jgi:transcription-repair coupling factor (superfamily II helicase)
MRTSITRALENLSALRALADAHVGELRVTGVAGSLAALLLDTASRITGRQIVAVGSDEDSAERLRDDLALVTETVQLFAGPTGRTFAAQAHQPVTDIQALRAFSETPAAIIVTSPSGLAASLPAPGKLAQSMIALGKHSPADLTDIVARLTEAGFEQKEFVAAHGDFAVRGGILDVFSFAGEFPVRAEFAGDAIESIREFDPLSQRSVRELEQAAILPDLLGAGSGGNGGAGGASLLDYADPRALVFLEEPALIRNAVEAKNSTAVARTWPAIEEVLEMFPRVVLETLGPHTEGTVQLGARPQPSFNGSVALVRKDLSALQTEGYEIIITCDNSAELARLKELLAGFPETGDDQVPLDVASIRFSLEAFHAGFIFPGARTALYTEHQMFNRMKRRGRQRPGRFKGFSERDVHRLVRGDFVVHQDFGIGRYDGMQRISVGGAEQEVVKVLYEENDTLFVNLNYVTKLQKYASREGHVPALSRLGGAEWEKLKARAKKKVKDIARELITLYARRKRAEGYACSPDSPWQKELEASFMYEDTFDQAKATLDVKKDMESPNPMDRLVCGDVGFGKTEVAVRAAFKAVLDGRQVAVLVPTTILATQHFTTFRDRLSRYGVRLEVMSRFRSKKELSEVAGALREGQVDIVIGTHRLLSRDIAFKNLGLLIIDEEHRFGVAAKEKLRHMRAAVDTLSLTATPIPRTLHFSLMGARDLSIIATPPRNRLPVATEILQWNDEVIRDAVLRELQRGGQVYFVHDRVQTMEDVIARLKRLLPSVRTCEAHGQMSAHALEGVMVDFVERRCDMLVATKIIESGLDIPNVNTIIINRADRFGMAELYQLRGRVGRSNVQAYALLLTPPVGVMPRQTLQRLQAVEEFIELGSGFNLAMRDLEIRGAGNLLGAEQSGFIEHMGFETYSRILEEAVMELKEEEFSDLFDRTTLREQSRTESVVETDLSALIPDTYVRSDTERLAMYRQLYALTTTEQLQEVREEMTDRFGALPPETGHLFGMITLRLAASASGFPRIRIRGEILEIEFPPESASPFYESAAFQHMMTAVAGMKSRGAELRPAGKVLKLSLRFASSLLPAERIGAAISTLSELTGQSFPTLPPTPPPRPS